MISTTHVQKIEAEVEVSASLDDVWRAWTTNEGVRTFFARGSNVELRFRGPFEIFFDGEIGSNGCAFLTYVPGAMISFSWNAPPHLAHARQHETFVVVRFDAVESGRTRVRLTHLGFSEMKALFPEHTAEWDDVHSYFSKAWPFVLENLKRRFDEGPRWDADGNQRWE